MTLRLLSGAWYGEKGGLEKGLLFCVRGWSFFSFAETRRGLGECFDYDLRQLVFVPFREQFVPGAGYRQQFGYCWDSLQRSGQFIDGTKPILRSVNEQRWSLEAREVLRA